ncbi:MAG: o-succinylbenzoate synthase [Ilumatobacter sp.]|uniref:o-succinylbenzoate synthase n=1 Tax=Ilumatobacter sp. TaxID=1967498 RepID=UPI0026115804|nr:o-succinylbenzoate synthase [Ilumatobacter sp.]MDJ0769325.1 o-succinylbenzoate synthase [Ilumatobacter sp.]
MSTLREIELRRIALDLVTPFRTSFGSEERRDILLVRIGTSDGDGWGECVAMAEPSYSPEFVDAAQLVIAEHLWPRLCQADHPAAASVAGELAAVKGHPMAKASLEMALLDAELRAAGQNLRDHFGARRDRVPSGVSVGIFGTLDELLAQVQGYVDDGYARIKLKIEPGWDLEPVAAVRDMIGDELGLQVDANTAYRRSDIAHLCRLDDFGLLLIEQPLPEDDLLGHAQLARESATPICLDESIVSWQTALDAIDLGATEIVNIKPGRVGGYLEARRIHDLCLDRGVPVWCGGMVETGIGRAANAALAALPGFTLPGDISASSRFYRRDIVIDPITVDDGHVSVPTGPGLGFELDHDFLDEITTSAITLPA